MANYGADGRPGSSRGQGAQGPPVALTHIGRRSSAPYVTSRSEPALAQIQQYSPGIPVNVPAQSMQQRTMSPAVPHINTAIGAYRQPLPSPSTHSPVVDRGPGQVPPSTLTPVSMGSPIAPPQMSTSAQHQAISNFSLVQSPIVQSPVVQSPTVPQTPQQIQQMDRLAQVIDLTMISDDEDRAQEGARKRQRTGEREAQAAPIKDDAMDTEPSLAPEPDPTKNEDLIKDALDAAFDEDDEDETKCWCLMCTYVLPASRIYLTHTRLMVSIAGPDSR